MKINYWWKNTNSHYKQCSSLYLLSFFMLFFKMFCVSMYREDERLGREKDFVSNGGRRLLWFYKHLYHTAFFLCVCMCKWRTQKKATSRGSNVWNKVRENLCVTTEKWERELFAGKKSQDKQRKMQQQFWYMREINFLDHERFPLSRGHSAKKCARLAIATRDASANHKINFNKRTL